MPQPGTGIRRTRIKRHQLDSGRSRCLSAVVRFLDESQRYMAEEGALG